MDTIAIKENSRLQKELLIDLLLIIAFPIIASFLIADRSLILFNSMRPSPPPFGGSGREA